MQYSLCNNNKTIFLTQPKPYFHPSSLLALLLWFLFLTKNTSSILPLCNKLAQWVLECVHAGEMVSGFGSCCCCSFVTDCADEQTREMWAGYVVVRWWSKGDSRPKVAEVRVERCCSLICIWVVFIMKQWCWMCVFAVVDNDGWWKATRWWSSGSWTTDGRRKRLSEGGVRDQGNGFDGVGEYGFVKMIEVSKNENEKNPAKWSNVFFPTCKRDLFYCMLHLYFSSYQAFNNQYPKRTKQCPPRVLSKCEEKYQFPSSYECPRSYGILHLFLNSNSFKFL